ncbi:WecB/TagA/CpsF family glycosyltransferase [Cellulomonas bogoriensis]|uniref:Glycosyl transferase n=1 Tax=Cellulomonas bogoriensis 69B4 = DSM 16987 TaxID=1386082 RepID=A0A0A0BRW5_9CELL|nr:WecB/TagA/CpsF family glycosyltransferase [Cellulomonas bogoriensis]KGM09874.1 hypothetical protein N869_05915 [Cellulomonas bogoriensis 69B4 = DSM 16987]
MSAVTAHPAADVVVGVRVHAVGMAAAVEAVMTWVRAAGPPRVAVGVNAYVCTMAAKDVAFSDLLDRADLAYADGQSVVWAARLLGLAVPERVATTDLLLPLARACAEQGARVFMLGGAPGVAALAAAALRERVPGLAVATADGFEDLADEQSLLARIDEHGTDVLLVGLGDPLQQVWADRFRAATAVPAILTCGGLFDWASGRHRRAPAWMIRAGLEWAWRLMIEPRRLARRYLVGNVDFLARLGAQLVVRTLRGRVRSSRQQSGSSANP